MANEEQLNSVISLHSINDRTLTGYDQTIGQYNMDVPTMSAVVGDPYELYYAQKALDELMDVPISGIPVVLQSTIGDVTPDGITVVWDRQMIVTCDISSQITLLVDDNPVTVDEVQFHPSDKSIMGILIGRNFTSTEVVTWTYDDTGLCDLHQIATPQTEASTVTHDVVNDLT